MTAPFTEQVNGKAGADALAAPNLLSAANVSALNDLQVQTLTQSLNARTQVLAIAAVAKEIRNLTVSVTCGFAMLGVILYLGLR